VTISEGTNHLVENSGDAITRALNDVIASPAENIRCPDLWDGKAAKRIVQTMMNIAQAEHRTGCISRRPSVETVLA